MAVGVLEVEDDRRRRLRGATADLRDVELDPIRETDADAMLGARHRAADRTGRGFEYTRDHDTRSSPFDVHLEFDRLEERRVDGGRHRPIDPPVGRPFPGLATA